MAIVKASLGSEFKNIELHASQVWKYIIQQTFSWTCGAYFWYYVVKFNGIVLTDTTCNSSNAKHVLFHQVGSPKTHRRFLARNDGTYGPMPRGKPKGLLAMPFNTTVSLRIHLPLGDSDSVYWMTSPCYKISWTEIGVLNLQSIDGLYCVGDSCFPGQGVIAVAFSGIMCAHRVAADVGKFSFYCACPWAGIV